MIGFTSGEGVFKSSGILITCIIFDWYNLFPLLKQKNPHTIVITYISAYFGKNATLLEKFNKEIDSALPIILNYGETTNVKDVSTITEALKKFYFNNSLVTTDSARGLIDVSIICDVYVATDLNFSTQSKECNSQLYFYIFINSYL